MNELVAASVKPGTLTAYQRHWSSLESFCSLHALEFRAPISRLTIAMFIAYLFHNKSLMHSTIKCYLSGISFMFNIHGVEDATNCALVSKTMKGIRNSETRSTAPLLPITKDILVNLLSQVQFVISDDYSRKLLKALFLLTFHACLRVGEAVISKSDCHTLQLADLSFGISHNLCTLQLNFKSYKHSGNLSPNFTLISAPRPELCPVQAMRSYLMVRGSDPGFLFVDRDFIPLIRARFLSHLKLCLVHAGFDSTRFNTHSFRVGRATQMATDKVDEATIKISGRWKSNAFSKYIRHSTFVLPN